MPRVKRGTTAKKRRKHVLQHAKGFTWGRKSKYRLAKDALRHAWTYAYRDRKANKRTMRALWQVQVNAAARANGVTYSRFMGQLKKKNIALDRKVLAQLAEQKPEIFQKLLAQVMN
ncbi:MAG: 50S ribosomal protein L20 [Parcubacteria group bacterium]|nr:50S ribosomal protein L20 [Parcubacteria group bacterium]